MSPTIQKARVAYSAEATGEYGAGESPTQLVHQILKHRDAGGGPASGEEDIAATVTVMLRVQPPSSALLMVANAKHRQRFELALKSAGFEVTVAPSKDRAVEAMLAGHFILAVTDRLAVAMRDIVSSEAMISEGIEMKLTASFGLAGINNAPKEVKRLAERLLAAADQALYRRKKAGRNGVSAEKLKWEPSEALTSPDIA